MSEGEDSGCVQCSAVDNGWFGKCSRHSEGTHLHVLEQRVEYVRDSLPSTLTTLKLTLPLALTASLGVREAKRERDRRRRKQPDSNGASPSQNRAPLDPMADCNSSPLSSFPLEGNNPSSPYNRGCV